MPISEIAGLDLNRRMLAVAAAIVTLLSLACGQAGKVEATAQGTTPITPTVRFDPTTLERLGIRTAPAGRDSVDHRLHVPGSLEYASDRYAEVGTIQEGRVQRINVKPGDTVKKGQVLATLLVPAIASAQADALAAQAALKVAKDHAQRESSLLERKLTTAREFEQAAGDMTAREAEYAAAAARLKLFGAPVPDSEAAIRPDGTLALTSPIDGTVVARNAALGSYLEPNEMAFAVADTSVLWASLDIFESDLPYVSAGAAVEFSTDALPGKVYQSTIEIVEPQLGRNTRTSRARVVLPNKDGLLRAGQFLRATIQLKSPTSESGRLLIPGSSVQPLADRDVVFVQKEPGVFEVRTVSVSRRTHQLAELSDGLRAGELIVVQGAFILRGEVTKQ